MKRKNGDVEYIEEIQSFKIMIGRLLVIVGLLLFGFRVATWLGADAPLHVPTMDCFDVGASDFVMVGVEGNRDRRVAVGDSDAPLHVAVADFHGVSGVPADAVRHIDMAFYDGWRLQGTMLFWQVGMREWYVIVNDELRAECGVYRVDDYAVLLVMDGLR